MSGATNRIGVIGGALTLALSLGLACSRAETRSAETQPAGSFGTLTSPSAFELAATDGGALLAWISSPAVAISLARFDSSAELVDAVASSAIDAAPDARDLTLVEAGADVWTAWVDPAAARVRAALLGGGRSTPVFDLGIAWGGSSPEARGNLALGRRGGRALVLTRGASQPCADVPGDACFSFEFFELSRDGARHTGVPLSVPVPCAAHAAQLVTGRRGADTAADSAAFEYAICTRADSDAVLTVFSIEPERQYAAARRVLGGCVPLGAGRFAEESAFIAQCGADRRMLSWADPDGVARQRDISIRGVVCDNGQPRVRLGREWLSLNAPVDRLELLVGDDLAPPGARAAWTGRALLVVKAGAAGLELTRYACQGSQLARLEGPALRS